MKQSPFDKVLEELKEAMLAISISNIIFNRKCAKAQAAIDEAVSNLEEAYRIDEVKAHIPQNTIIQFADMYSGLYNKETNTVKPLNLVQFNESQKGKTLKECILDTDALTRTEKIEILNEMGMLKGQDGKTKLTAEGLKAYIEKYGDKAEGLIDMSTEGFENETLGAMSFKEFKGFYQKLLDYIPADSLDKQLLTEHMERLTSVEFIANCQGKSTKQQVLNCLSSNLTEQQSVRISEERAKIAYKDPYNFTGARSMTSLSAFEKEGFSILATEAQRIDEVQQGGIKLIQEVNSAFSNIVKKMPEKFTTVLAGETFITKDLTDNKKVQIQQEMNEKNLKGFSAFKLKNECDNKLKQAEAKQKADLALFSDEKNALSLAHEIAEFSGSFLFPGSNVNAQLANAAKELLTNELQTLKDLGVPEEELAHQETLISNLEENSKEMEGKKDECRNSLTKIKESVKTFEKKRGKTNEYSMKVQKEELQSQIQDLKNQKVSKEKQLSGMTDLGQREQLKKDIKTIDAKMEQLKNVLDKNIIKPQPHKLSTSSSERNKNLMKEAQSKSRESGDSVRTRAKEGS